MRMQDLEDKLLDLDHKYQKAVYTTKDLRLLLQEKSESTFNKTIQRAVQTELLHRASRGIFVFNKTTKLKYYIGIDLVNTFRPDSINYLSLEYALNIWGVISQMPFRASLMTTGASGELYSPLYGHFVFIHTSRDIESDIKKKNIIVYPDRLSLAKPHIALRDLKSVGKLLYLVDMEAYEEALEEAEAMPV